MDAAIARPRPMCRGLLHAYGLLVAVPACVALVVLASRAAERTSAAVFAVALVASLGASAAYHRLPRTDRARAMLRRLDHSMIFVLIAGTYTPVCLVGIPLAWGVPLLCVVWAGAIVGVTLKLTCFDRFVRLGYALYPLLGWVAVVSLPVMVTSLPVAAWILILAGGVIYTIGFPVLLRHRPDPWPRTFGYHEVWHTCTLGAAVCHFVAIAIVVT
jgi:hemolysin III